MSCTKVLFKMTMRLTSLVSDSIASRYFCSGLLKKLEQKVVIRTGLFKMTTLTSLVSDSIVDTFVVV